MIQYLRRLVQERNALTALQTSLTEQASGEDRELTDPEQQRLRDWQTRCAELDGQIEEHNAQVESQRAWARLQSTIAEQQTDEQEQQRLPERVGARVPAQRDADWGERVTASEQFRSYTGHGTSGRVEVPFEVRAPIMTTDLEQRPQRWDNPPVPTYTNPLLGVIGTERVSVGAVEWLYWGPTPDAPASVVPEGALKPEATITVTPMTSTLQTYAHWKAITRQALEDIPRIRQIIEGKLRGGLARALEIAATTALTDNTDIPDVPIGTGDNALAAAIREGMAQVQVAGYTPNAVLLNPADWAAIDVSLLLATLNGPIANNSVWGLRPIAVPGLDAGTAFVGDFASGVTLFDRGVANVFLTDSHADYFIRNQQVILAETRATVQVTEPYAMARVGAAAAPAVEAEAA